ncbi:MAG TPA: hypothetical protein DD001_03140 [Microcoleaceae bacterium UBA10368]|nr:hypothetical protein [Microcoleaceae cyanobacterium UBA11344]HBK96374.1 hypothetical protein [Microcoleaceae cyanobacterium UBA10368]HCV32339.1 hypothetical protein [Microcoleaceae cyanobacterium UBA9251]
MITRAKYFRRKREEGIGKKEGTLRVILTRIHRLMIERESKVRNQESEGREKRAAFARKQRVVDRLFWSLKASNPY